MELLAAHDPYIMLSLFMSFMLTLCLLILFLMRDPYAVPPRQVSRSVWCPERHRGARVDFVEWVDTGMVHRSVRQCSLRGVTDRCDGTCSRQPA
jgi:hypothetical protein